VSAAPVAAPRRLHGAFSNAAVNLVAGVLPFPLAIVTVPAVIRGFGVERYGVLAMAGVVLAYFALLDVGLGRAGTRFLARSLGSVGSDAADTFWTAVALAVAVGLAGAGILLAVAAPLVQDLLHVPAGLMAETRSAFKLLALAVPLAILGPTLLGALEAQRRFDLVAAIQVPAAVLGLLAPLFVLPWTTHLVPAILAIAAVQAGVCIAALGACLATIPQVRRSMRVHPRVVRELLGYGRWVAVSNLVGPLMVNADRLAIGAVLSVRLVTYYAAPYELVTRLLLVPSSLMRAMFPVFSADRTPEVRDARALAADAARTIALVLGPAAVLVVALAPDVLRVWLGADFARLSASSLALLAVGVTMNALAMVPFWLLQGLGRPDLCAKFHLVELALYVPLLFLLLRWWGITGAAAAWTFRVALDGGLLVGAARRVVGFDGHRDRLRALVTYGALLAVAFALSHLVATRVAGGATRFAGAVVLASAMVASGWRMLLSAGERSAVVAAARAGLRRKEA
jgi:O-antigen/teichoic acid export membrane protein